MKEPARPIGAAAILLVPGARGEAGGDETDAESAVIPAKI
jgi:hypothetical protein